MIQEIYFLWSAGCWLFKTCLEIYLTGQAWKNKKYDVYKMLLTLTLKFLWSDQECMNCRQMKIDPFQAVGVLLQTRAIMAADALAPCVARLSAAMMITSSSR